MMINVQKNDFYPDLQTYLLKNKVEAEILDLHVPMKTAQAAADQLQVAIAQIIKSILLIYKKTKEQKEYVLVVLPGDASVDLQKLADLKGWNKNKISFANSDAVLQHTGFPAGGTPPIGHKEPLAVVMNKRLLDLDVGYAGGGKPEWLLKISPKEIQRLTCAQLL